MGDSALGPGDSTSLAEPTGMGGKEGEGVFIGSSPVPRKGWFLPRLGSGHARVTEVSQLSSITLGRRELPLPWSDTQSNCSVSSSFLGLPDGLRVGENSRGAEPCCLLPWYPVLPHALPGLHLGSLLCGGAATWDCPELSAVLWAKLR